MPFLVDTNIVVAYYKPGDPLHEPVVSMLKSGRGLFQISPVGLFELYSVISRIRGSIILPEKFRETPVDVLIRFIIRDLDLRPIAATYLVKLREFKVRIPLEYYLCIILSKRLRLRALDMLHIAYASILRDKVEAFVTGDHELLEKRNLILREAKVRVKEPGELLESL